MNQNSARDFVTPSEAAGRHVWPWCVLAFLFLVLIAGGNPRYGSYGDVPIELLSLPLILFATLRLAGQPAIPGRRAAFALCGAILLLPLLQLIPLPPALWTALPGRGFVLDTLEAARTALPWMPLSLSPPATLRSFLSLFPPLAIFLTTLTLTHQERRIAVLLIIAFGMASVVLGLAQIASGRETSLYLYDVTNRGLAVGLFANRNHFAALLYCVMPLTAAWMIHLVQTEGMGKWAGVALAAVIYGALILGLGISGSRAGVGFAMLAIVASVLLAWRKSEHKKQQRASKVVFIAGLVGIFGVLQFGLAGILSRLGQDPLEEGRLAIAEVTWRAASSVFPAGSGIGTFVPYYAMFEMPVEIGPRYVNHAHNDWLELWLEGGVPVVLIALAFLAWLVLRIGATWKQENRSSLDWLLARAASILVILILLHSFVDYPLRTTALASLFAFGCALILDLPKETRRSSRRNVSQRREDMTASDRRHTRSTGKSDRKSSTGVMVEEPIRPFSSKTGKFQAEMLFPADSPQD